MLATVLGSLSVGLRSRFVGVERRPVATIVLALGSITTWRVLSLGFEGACSVAGIGRHVGLVVVAALSNHVVGVWLVFLADCETVSAGRKIGVRSEVSLGGIVFLLVAVLLEISDSFDVVLELGNMGRVLFLSLLAHVAWHVVFSLHVVFFDKSIGGGPLENLDFEGKGSIGRNGAFDSSLTVGKARRAFKNGSLTISHKCDTLVPTLDDLTNTYLEFEAFIILVENGTVFKSTLVGDLNSGLIRDEVSASQVHVLDSEIFSIIINFLLDFFFLCNDGAISILGVIRHSKFALKISPGVKVCLSIIAGERRLFLRWVIEFLDRE